MSIFSSPQKRTEQSALKVQRLRAELDAAEREHRALRAESLVERLRACGDDTLRTSDGTLYGASSLAGQCATASYADLDRIAALLDSHDRAIRERPAQRPAPVWVGRVDK